MSIRSASAGPRFSRSMGPVLSTASCLRRWRTAASSTPSAASTSFGEGAHLDLDRRQLGGEVRDGPDEDLAPFREYLMVMVRLVLCPRRHRFAASIESPAPSVVLSPARARLACSFPSVGWSPTVRAMTSCTIFQHSTKYTGPCPGRFLPHGVRSHPRAGRVQCDSPSVGPRRPVPAPSRCPPRYCRADEQIDQGDIASHALIAFPHQPRPD